jgi:hypothetical protein
MIVSRIGLTCPRGAWMHESESASVPERVMLGEEGWNRCKGQNTGGAWHETIPTKKVLGGFEPEDGGREAFRFSKKLAGSCVET